MITQFNDVKYLELKFHDIFNLFDAHHVQGIFFNSINKIHLQACLLLLYDYNDILLEFIY